MIVCRIELVRECCEMKKEWQIVFKNKGVVVQDHRIHTMP